VALPTFDAAKHHIGLGTGAGTLKGFMLDGGYVKEVQRETKGGQQEFGGQTDLIGSAPSMSRWTQDDFVGGMGAMTWGRDDAMFADSTGFMPDQQSRSLISVPPMFQKKTGMTTATPKSIFMVAGKIFIVTSGTIQSYDVGTGSTASVTPPAGDTYAFAEYDSVDQKIWAGVKRAGTVPGIYRYNVDFSLPSVDGFYVGPSYTAGWSVPGGTIFNALVVMQIGRKIFVGDPPTTPMARRTRSSSGAR